MAKEDGTAGAPQEGALPKDIIDEIDGAQQSLSVTRKKCKIPWGYTSPADMKNFTTKHTTSSLDLPSPAGMTSIALSRPSPGQFLTGGNDKPVQLYDRGTDKVLAPLKGHTKRVNRVASCKRDESRPLCFLQAQTRPPRCGDMMLLLMNISHALQSILTKVTPRASPCIRHRRLSRCRPLIGDRTYSLHELSGFTQVYHSATFEDPFTALSIHPNGALLPLGMPTSKIQVCSAHTGG